jgi:hypothetical protein
MHIINRFNPGGIRATLERWQADPDQQNRWVAFDGISVSLYDRASDCPYRVICRVSELGCVLGNGAHLSLDEFLHSDI